MSREVQITPELLDRARPRFWAKVTVAPSLFACWIWSGKPNRHGYGRYCFSGSQVDYAHRISWCLTRGEIPDGFHVLHACDNPPCVNPLHLFLGTQGDNNRDMVGKGRHWMQRPDHPESSLERWGREHPELKTRGEKHGQTKLTDARVVEIRERHARGEVQSKLAEEFGIAQITLSRIVRGESWKHVGGPIVTRGKGWRQPKEETAE